MLHIFCPESYQSDRSWIVDAVGRRLADEWSIHFEDRDDWCLSHGQAKSRIHLPDLVIPKLRAGLDFPTDTLFWNANILGLDDQRWVNMPVLHVFEAPHNQSGWATDVNVPVDIFGMAFWVMSRWEETSATA